MHDAKTIMRLTQMAHGGGCGCKLAPDVLGSLLDPLLQGIEPLGGGLLVGAGTRDDAAAYRIDGERALLLTTDFFTPMVDDPYQFGYIAAANAVSDIFAMGGKPMMALSVLAMPTAKIPPETIARILEGGRDASGKAGAVIAGGHSIDSAEPIYGLAVAGTVPLGRMRTNALAKPGDAIILGKPLGIGILCTAFQKGALDGDGLETMLKHAMQVNAVGAELADRSLVHAMTDVTGFGLLGHLSEVCVASRCSARIAASSIPMIARAVELADQGTRTGASERNWRGLKGRINAGNDLPGRMKDMLTDPQTNGGLLVTCAKNKVQEVLDLFRENGFAQAAPIGEIRQGEPVVHVQS